MAKKKGITALLDTAKHSTRTPMTKRMGAKMQAAVDKDIKAIFAAEQGGQPVPSLPKIADYLFGEYGIPVGPTVIGNWLRKLRCGATSIWA